LRYRRRRQKSRAASKKGRGRSRKEQGSEERWCLQYQSPKHHDTGG
jgi:hypothetical protein